MQGNIRPILTRRGIKWLYHFSRIDLIPSILRDGLLPRKELLSRGIVFDDDPGKWGTWQKAEEFEAYVALSIQAPWGMMQGRDDVFLVRISAEVLEHPDTLFSNLWSSDNEVTLEKLMKANSVADFDAMFSGAYTSFPNRLAGKKFCPGEVLVKGAVPRDQFVRVVFRNDSDLLRARELAARNGLAVGEGEFVVNPNAFGGASG